MIEVSNETDSDIVCLAKSRDIFLPRIFPIFPAYNGTIL